MIDGLDIITGSVNLNIVAVFLEGKLSDLKSHDTNKALKKKGVAVPKMPKPTSDEAKDQIKAMLQCLGQVRGTYSQLEKNLLLSRQKNYDDYKLILELKQEVKELKELNKNLMDGLN